MYNKISLDTITASLCYAMGIEPPAHAAAPAAPLVDYIDSALQGRKVDRVLMFNPDAISQWAYEKYPYYLREVVAHTELELPLCTVFPSVTPVCFGTMYTGAQPQVHGIREYDKPVIQIDTIFDALIRAGKKPLIIANKTCSLGMIYLQRDMDYVLADTMEQINAAAVKAILEDQHDFIVVYNGNYDYQAHRSGPEGAEALAELRCNSRTYAVLSELVKSHWQNHDTLMGFAMDHGGHAIEPYERRPGLIYRGTHGADTPEDMNIVHRYQLHRKTKYVCRECVCAPGF